MYFDVVCQDAESFTDDDHFDKEGIISRPVFVDWRQFMRNMGDAGCIWNVDDVDSVNTCNIGAVSIENGSEGWRSD